MPTNILMICLGNICRSPLAEGLLQDKLPKDHFFVDSAGTGSWHIGHAPDSRSVAVAQKYGINISHQKCRQLDWLDFVRFDYIYVMDKSNLRDVQRLAQTKEQRNKVRLILEVLDKESTIEVPDPYYGGDQGFELVFDLLDRATKKIAEDLLATK